MKKIFIAKGNDVIDTRTNSIVPKVFESDAENAVEIAKILNIEVMKEDFNLLPLRTSDRNDPRFWALVMHTYATLPDNDALAYMQYLIPSFSDDELIVDWKYLGDENYSQAASTLGRKGGSIKSEKKAAASRENGRKGGRPKKKEE